MSRAVFDLPAPAVGVAEVLALVRNLYGSDALQASPLPSERDQNFLVEAVVANPHRIVRRFVLKIAHAAEDPAVIDMENAALQHLAAVASDLPLPRLVRTLAGEPTTTIDGPAGTHLVRVITALPGRALQSRVHEGQPVSQITAEAVGAGCARLSVALQGFFHPAAGRELDWDVRRLGELSARRGAPRIPSRTAHALARLTALPAGVQHGDVTLTNVLTDTDGVLTGIVDLGDMHHTAAVCDLAATLTSVLRGVEGETLWSLTAAVLRGYQRHRPLQPAEVDVLGELVIARLLITLAVSAHRAPQHLDNTDYITQYDADSRALLDRLTAITPGSLRGRLRRLAGLGAPGLPGAPASSSQDLLTRRRAVQAGGLSPLFYAEPLDIVAAEGVWLTARDGRRYLDGYNNVAVVGHSHPSVVSAITRQAPVLHTHSRYLHPNVIELAERLVASMPPGSGLDTCLFTASGTEANELAWRLSVEYTSAVAGRPAGYPAGDVGAIIGSNAYHGSSRWLADLSSMEWPAGYRPAGVATFDGPVQHDALLTRAEGLARIEAAAAELRAAGRHPAMVIADSMFTSEGVRTVPPEFMAALVDGAHAAGALYVADEVQIGFGRSGPKLWWFAELGVRPDVVTMGKPMGAGYPIAATITRREIADVLASRYEFFSTFAGNPVGTAASLAVLDILEDQVIDGLTIPAHAVRLGQQVRERAAAVREKHLGASEADEAKPVRGHGLIAGIDLPSKPVATAVKEGLKARGILVGTTGRTGATLKVRPPLVWQDEHVELFVTAFDEALGVGLGAGL